MKINKRIILILIFLVSFNLFAQESEKENDDLKNVNPFENSFWEATDYFVGFSPLLYLNTSSMTDGPVSPLYYPVSFGFIWPNDYFFSIQPSINFFTSYFYMKNGKVIPSEIENRTALAYNLLINIPAVFKMNFWEKSNITLSGGIALLIRFAGFASDVSENDYGDTGSAASDLSAINNFFWSNFRFFYLSLGADWIFKITDDIKFGPQINIYLPIGTIISDFSFDGLMVSLGIKVVF